MKINVQKNNIVQFCSVRTETKKVPEYCRLRIVKKMIKKQLKKYMEGPSGQLWGTERVPLYLISESVIPVTFRFV